MKRFTSLCLALASAWIAAAQVQAARPYYGGTLRAAVAGTIRSANPSAPADGPEAAARERVLPLVFETLTRVDADSGLQPLLSASWTSDSAGSRWTLRLQRDVMLHDGSTLEPWQVATALRTVEPRWRIATDGDALIIDAAEPTPDLPWRLADVSHAVAVRSSSDQWLGTGPFRLDRLDNTSVTLRANDAYRGGRPFVDGVQVQQGRAAASQLNDLESGRIDIAAVLPTDARRIVQRGMRAFASRPIELVAVVFEPNRRGDAFAPVRRTLAASINRKTMSEVLLQQYASPAVSLLPRWLSGFAVEGVDRNRTLMRGAVAALPVDQRELTVRVDASDSLAQAIAERVAVDARESGLTIKVQAPTGLAPRPDARLVRVRAAPAAPERAFSDLLGRLASRAAGDALAPSASPPGSIDEVYRTESSIIDRSVVIPIVHLPDVYAAVDRLSVWQAPPVLGTGAWNFADVWLRAAQP